MILKLIYRATLTEKSVYSWVDVDVDTSGSRAQLKSVLKPLAENIPFHFHFCQLWQKKAKGPKMQACAKISLTFRGGKTLDPGTLHPDQEYKDYHKGQPSGKVRNIQKLSSRTTFWRNQTQVNSPYYTSHLSCCYSRSCTAQGGCSRFHHNVCKAKCWLKSIQ